MTYLNDFQEKQRVQNPNYIIIGQNEIEEGLKYNLIKEIGRSKSNNGNIYYLINPTYVSNAILMHIKDEKHIVINNRIACGNNSINLMDILPDYSFYCKSLTGKVRERVVTRVSKKHNINIKHIAIERLITSYGLYGDIVKMKKDFHVHHKSKVFDNREFTTMLVHKSIHKDTKSHLEGCYVDSYESFVKLLKQLQNNNEYYRTVNWVE